MHLHDCLFLHDIFVAMCLEIVFAEFLDFRSFLNKRLCLLVAQVLNFMLQI